MNVEKYPRRWTHNEQELLKSLYEKGLTAKQISRKLHRSESAVYCRLYSLGLSEKGKRIQPWLQAEEDFLIKHYSIYRMWYLAKKLGRTEKAIIARARFLKLRSQG